VGLGGKEIEIRRYSLLEGKIEGLEFFTDAVPLPEIGHADGRDLDVLVGARTMEQWQIGLDPATGSLNLDALRRREFTEFCERAA
jgi:hypothetical protein